MKAPVKRPAPKQPVWPWDPVLLEPFEVSAVKAVAAQMPLAWAALEKITGADRMSFTEGGEDGRRATDFAEGRRWVGNTLRNIRDMKMPGAGAPRPHEPRDPLAVPIGPPPGE